MQQTKLVKEKPKKLKVYQVNDGIPENGGVLVIAEGSHEAKVLAWQITEIRDWVDEYIDLRVQLCRQTGQEFFEKGELDYYKALELGIIDNLYESECPNCKRDAGVVSHDKNKGFSCLNCEDEVLA